MNGDLSVARRLTSLPAGLELMTLVESLDPAGLDGEAAVALLTAEHRLSYRVNKYDPDAAARRAARARDCRRVDYQVTEDGTAVINAVGLPVEQAAAAIERVDAFALAARLDGDPRSLQQLRADALLG